MKLFYHLKRGKLMFIGKPLFISMVIVELCWERIIDQLFAPRFESTRVDKCVTAVIKTFERPKELKRLIKSIKRFYPNMKIIVVDDNRKSVHLDGVKTIEMPYDSGVSAGRNNGVAHVETKYLLLLDDDFIFYRKTDLEPAVKKLAEHPEIDIMGGQVVDLPLYLSTEFRRAALYSTIKKPIMPVGSQIGGMAVYDKVANFYIAQTSSIRRVGWDERIKRLDHAEFFTRAKGVLTTVFNPDFKVLHAQAPFNRVYMAKRDDSAADQKLIYEKYFKK